jgi:hypothetical protein
VNAIAIMVIAFAVPLLIMAFITARLRRAHRYPGAADDAAVRDLYDRYAADVKALTKEYLLHAPPDDEWLAKIRKHSEVPDRQQRASRLPLRPAGRKPRSLARAARGLGGHPRSLRSLEIPIGALTAAITISLLAHSLLGQGRINWWLAPISVVVALGTTVGKLIGSVGREDQAEAEDDGRTKAPRQSC